MMADHKGYPIQITVRRIPIAPYRWYVYATLYPPGVNGQRRRRITPTGRPFLSKSAAEEHALRAAQAYVDGLMRRLLRTEICRGKLLAQPIGCRRPYARWGCSG
jgi:hypothetical protein